MAEASSVPSVRDSVDIMDHRIAQAQLYAEVSIGIGFGRSLAKLPVMKFLTKLDRDEDADLDRRTPRDHGLR